MKDLQESVFSILGNLRDLDGLKKLFWSELNYDQINQPLSRRGWPDGAATALAEDPLLLAGHEDFGIIYGRLRSRLLITPERAVVNRLLRDHPYALFIFCNDSQTEWHLVNVKLVADRDEEKNRDTVRRRLFRRIKIGPEERLRTAAERITLLDLDSIAETFGVSPLAIQQRHDEAFDVEAVTDIFFRNYQAIFNILEADLRRQTGDPSWAHDYALQFLNRIMFLYFVQRKRWLGNNPEFLKTFWEAYQEAKQPPDTFFSHWLAVLFFEAFNNKFSPPRHLPSQIREALQIAPYLNGGLFTRNRLDDKSFTISDRLFRQVFNFFEGYNFTISENSPLDQEVAVDPEMIGKVYESLVNVSPDLDTRGEAGIFYTPRTEIDLMCRLALVDRLANDLGKHHQTILYEAIFAFEQDDKDAADVALAKQSLWPEVSHLLRELTVLDPACGSGSFLVGMLTILTDLTRRANAQLGDEEDEYELKKRIIGQNLYGVDVMDWAVQVAELRLWLHLIVDTEIPLAERKISPLLPNLSFKVRCGDSLVQEVAGINLARLKTPGSISGTLRKRLSEIKKRKVEFYRAESRDPEAEKRAIEHEELRLFRDILAYRQHNLENEAKDLRRKIDWPQKAQIRLDGTVERSPLQLKLRVVDWQKQLDEIKTELEALGRSRSALTGDKDIPFVWDIAFVEIFVGDHRGFDIVIGNPPYVRQEDIADPKLTREDKDRMTADRFRESKKQYKAKLARSVYTAYPHFFGYKAKDEAAARKLDAKSDLYIYFYLYGLSLLNSKGSFCFITSNSWLDVGYGKDLQEFLLRHSQVKLILDNQARRSFSQADVNTIIALFSAPDDKNDGGLEQTARFVMFQVPFEEILSPVIFEEIDEARERRSTPEYRVFPILQRQLLEEGLETVRDKDKVKGPLIKVARYLGNKWGGKYLRAPDIYWTILEKGKRKLVRLGDIAEVRFGIKTGANEFFYLDEAKIREWGIEAEFLQPVIKSPRECKRILIDPHDLKFKIFMCHKEKGELKGTAALEYIKWGESQGFHKRPSCAGRSRWWNLGVQEPFDFVVLRFRDKRNWNPINETPSLLAGDIMFVGSWHDRASVLTYNSILNTTFLTLISEILGRVNLGDGLLTTYGPEILRFEFIESLSISNLKVRELEKRFKTIEKRIVTSIFEEINQADRRALDDIIFDALGLTQGERDAVYEAVIHLVETRLQKARSL
ncbi:MAG: hypothetical protein DRG58_10350 [Deltaproteobacteria bacterium]|nr:MAG: hypothetical protein DRG58_10350 [Deltaproteobacteria bacterium]